MSAANFSVSLVSVVTISTPGSTADAPRRPTTSGQAPKRVAVARSRAAEQASCRGEAQQEEAMLRVVIRTSAIAAPVPPRSMRPPQHNPPTRFADTIPRCHAALALRTARAGRILSLLTSAAHCFFRHVLHCHSTEQLPASGTPSSPVRAIFLAKTGCYRTAADRSLRGPTNQPPISRKNPILSEPIRVNNNIYNKIVITESSGIDFG